MFLFSGIYLSCIDLFQVWKRYRGHDWSSSQLVLEDYVARSQSCSPYCPLYILHCELHPRRVTYLPSMEQRNCKPSLNVQLFLKKRILSSGKCKSYRMIDRHIGRIILICVSGHVLTLIVYSSGKIKSSGISPLWSTLHWAALGIICQLCSPDSIICLLQEKETWKPTWEATYN